MASTRPSMRRSPDMPRDTRVLTDELRTIVGRRSAGQAQPLVADFAVRHHLTHRDVDALVTALAEDGVAASPQAPAATPYSEEPAISQSATAARIPIQAVPASTKLESMAGQPETHGPDNGLSWLFGEEPEPSSTRADDDILGQTFDDLLGDWCRTGGRLTRAEVALLAEKRKLSVAQHGELLALLEDAGVDLPDPAGPRPRRSAVKGYELQEDSVGQYLRTIARYPLIGAVREVELWSLISQGLAAREQLDASDEDTLSPDVRRSLRARAEAGRRAHAELVCANLRLVVSIARLRTYDRSGVDFADRIQDGNVGLMRAADKFDGSKGFKFSTYATWWIRQSIERGIADRGRIIRIPVHVHEQVQRVRKTLSQLTTRFDREPTLAELSDATGLEPGTVQAALDLMRPFCSLDAAFGDDGDLHLSDLLTDAEERDGRADPAEIVIQAMCRRDITRVLRAVLPERAACVLERRFGIGTGDEETLDNIGADYGVTRERIRQVEGSALKKLRMSGRAAMLRSYLVDDAHRSDHLTERKAS